MRSMLHVQLADVMLSSPPCEHAAYPTGLCARPTRFHPRLRHRNDLLAASCSRWSKLRPRRPLHHRSFRLPLHRRPTHLPSQHRLRHQPHRRRTLDTDRIEPNRGNSTIPRSARTVRHVPVRLCEQVMTSLEPLPSTKCYRTLFEMLSNIFRTIFECIELSLRNSTNTQNEPGCTRRSDRHVARSPDGRVSFCSARSSRHA